MYQEAYESTRQRRPSKIYTNTKLVIMQLYFRREKTLEEISSDFDIPLTEIKRWLRTDLADTAEYFNELHTQIELEQMRVGDVNVESQQKIERLEAEVLDLYREIQALRKTKSNEDYEDLLYSVTGQR